MAELTLADLRVWLGDVFRHTRFATQSDLETVLAGLVNPGRLEVVTPCEHGISVEHLHGFGPQTAHCPGGSRRLIGENE